MARYTYSPGYIDSPAMQERDLNGDGDFGDTNEVVYYHSNTLHSIYALTDGSENVVERYRYSAYGQSTVLDPDWSVDADAASDAENPYRFTARRLDAESGLMQYRKRYYDPDHGRFISRDPTGYRGGLNLCEALGSSPANLRDPFGLQHCGSGSTEAWVPDEPFGYNFGDACKWHDDCYGNCEQAASWHDTYGDHKNWCDSHFAAKMRGWCEQNTEQGTINYRLCMHMAEEYHAAVFWLGGPAYRKAQAKCCGGEKKDEA